MTTSKQRICLPVAVIAIGMVAFPVQAASRKTDGATRVSGPAQARELRDKGIVAMNLGRYDDAVALLEEAYEQSREPSVLLDLVQAHRLNGNPERALVLCGSFLRSRPNLTPASRVEVEKTVAELGIIVEQIRLDGKPARPARMAPAKPVAKVTLPVEKAVAVEPPKVTKPEPVGAKPEPVVVDESEAAEAEESKEKEEVKPLLPPSAAKPTEIVKVDETERAAQLTKTAPPPREEKPRASWLRSPWLWTAAGVVAAGIVTSVVVYESTKDPGAPRTSWGSQKVF